MQLDLGYLEDFKGGDTLLVSGTPANVELLAQAVEEFAASDTRALVLNSRGHRVAGAELGLTKDSAPTPSGFWWLVTAADGPAVADELRAVARRSPAHQYFELVGSETRLMVAAGVYPPEWWRARA